MITYKGFEKGLICRGYQFKAYEVNVCEKAKTVREGFHSAENPLDVLTYYPNPETSEYWMCEVGGDVDEDGCDSKVSSTELTLMHETGLTGLLIWGAIAHCDREDFAESNKRKFGRPATASRGYAISICEDARAKGKDGDLLLIVGEDDAVLLKVGEDGIKPNVWYNARGEEVQA